MENLFCFICDHKFTDQEITGENMDLDLYTDTLVNAIIFYN